MEHWSCYKNANTLIYTRYRSNYKKKKINTNIQIYEK